MVIAVVVGVESCDGCGSGGGSRVVGMGMIVVVMVMGLGLVPSNRSPVLLHFP